MCLFPVHAQCATVHQNNNQRLASRGDSLHQIFLSLRHIQAGTVSAGKTGLLDWHLLAFKVAGDPDHSYDNVGVFRGSNGRRVRRIVHRRPDEMCFDLALSRVAVCNVNLHGLSLFQMNSADARSGAIHLHDRLVPDRDACEAVGFHADEVVASFSSCEKTRPLYR